jgi:CheY-like chemotaxis protein
MPKLILLAEDQPSARELLRAILSGGGYRVLEASDGHEAVRLADAAVPDLVLLDIQMPGRDGFSVCAELRADPRFAAVPIVAMTAGLMRGEKERATEAGFSEFLAKPISVATLRTTVATLLAD